MPQGNNTRTRVVTETLSKILKIHNTCLRTVKDYRIVLGFCLHATKGNNYSTGTFWIMKFMVREKAQILSKYHHILSLILVGRWFCQLLQTSLPQGSDTIRWNQSFWKKWNMAQRKGNGRLGTNEDTIQQVERLIQNDSTLGILATSS